MNCQLCQDNGWISVEIDGKRRVKKCVCEVRAKTVEEKAYPGGFQSAAEIGAALETGNRKLQAGTSSLEAGPVSSFEFPVSSFWSKRVADMTEPTDRELGMLILNHRGKANAVPIGEIVRTIYELDGHDPNGIRAVKASVERLRVLGKIPIAASKEKPYGYFIPQTAEECREMHDRIFGEGIKLIILSQLFQRDRDLCERLAGQLSFTAENAENRGQPEGQ